MVSLVSWMLKNNDHFVFYYLGNPHHSCLIVVLKYRRFGNNRTFAKILIAVGAIELSYFLLAEILWIYRRIENGVSTDYPESSIFLTTLPSCFSDFFSLWKLVLF
jgi:hypothetical protein